MIYACGQDSSFAGTIRLTGSVGELSSTVTTPLAANLFARAVVLDSPVGPFPAESVIELSRVGNGLVVEGHAPFCASLHLHAQNPAGVTIDGSGPFPDPAPGGCGYGMIVMIPK